MKFLTVCIAFALLFVGCSTKSSNDLKRSPCAPQQSYQSDESNWAVDGSY